LEPAFAEGYGGQEFLAPHEKQLWGGIAICGIQPIPENTISRETQTFFHRHP